MADSLIQFLNQLTLPASICMSVIIYCLFQMMNRFIFNPESIKGNNEKT